MIRSIVGLAIGLVWCWNVEGGVIANYDFNGLGNLNASSSQQGVGFSAGAFTSAALPGAVIQVPLVGVGGTGSAAFGATANRTSFVNQATLTLSRAAGVTVDSLNFDIRRSAIFGLNRNGTLRISNNLNSEVFDLDLTSSTFSNQSAIFSTPLQADSITFTFSSKASAGGVAVPTFTPIIDNFKVDGVVPEPASMAVFAVLGIAGMAAKRRFRRG